MWWKKIPNLTPHNWNLFSKKKCSRIPSYSRVGYWRGIALFVLVVFGQLDVLGKIKIIFNVELWAWFFKSQELNFVYSNYSVPLLCRMVVPWIDNVNCVDTIRMSSTCSWITLITNPTHWTYIILFAFPTV